MSDILTPERWTLLCPFCGHASVAATSHAASEALQEHLKDCSPQDRPITVRKGSDDE